MSRIYEICIENDRSKEVHIFRTSPSTPFRKVVKAYSCQVMMCDFCFEFYLGDRLIADSNYYDSMEEIIQGTKFYRSSGEIRVKAIMGDLVDRLRKSHYFYFPIKEYRLGSVLDEVMIFKAKRSTVFSRIGDAYSRRKGGGRFVFLWNGFEIDNERSAVDIFQDMMLVQREENRDVFITAILEEHYVRDE